MIIMECKIPGCENETQYDIDYWCEEHWQKYCSEMSN